MQKYTILSRTAHTGSSKFGHLKLRFRHIDSFITRGHIRTAAQTKNQGRSHRIAFVVQSKSRRPFPVHVYNRETAGGYLKPGDDGLGEILGRRLAAQVARQRLSFRQSIKGRTLDTVGVLVQAHVAQHHQRRQEQSGGVGEALAGDVGGGAVDGLEDGALVADVARRRQAQTADQASAHVGENVAVQVGHDENLVIVGNGIGGHLQAGVVQKLGIELNVGELLGDLVGDAQEETVAHLHDGGFVHDADLLAADGLGVLESVP